MLVWGITSIARWDFKPSGLLIAFVLGGFLSKFCDTDNDSNLLTMSKWTGGGHRNTLSHSGIPLLIFFVPVWYAGFDFRAIAAASISGKFLFNLAVQFVAYWALATATHLLADLYTKANYKRWKFLWWLAWGAFLAVAAVGTIVFLVI